MSENHRLAIFLPSLDGGGAERMMLALASVLASRGHSVDLVLATARGVFIADVPADVRLIDLGCRRVLTSLGPLLRYLHRERPLAVLSTLNHANLIALIASFFAPSQTRFVVREANIIRPTHHPADSDAPHIHTNSLRDYFIPPLMRLLYGRAHAIVAVSDDVSADIGAYIKGIARKVITIPNPVTPADIIERSQAPLDHPWFQTGEPPVVLSIGRLSAQKDHSTLIRAFHLLSNTMDARLLIFGEGPERAKLEALVQELGLHNRVSLPGFTQNPFAFMRNAAAFVLPSKYEGMPNVLLQAMACGARVVSTDCPGGPSAILQQGRWGELVAVGDAEAMSAAIIRALNTVGPDTSLRARDFSLEKAADAYMGVLMGNSALQ